MPCNELIKPFVNSTIIQISVQCLNTKRWFNIMLFLAGSILYYRTLARSGKLHVPSALIVTRHKQILKRIQEPAEENSRPVR